MAVTITNLTAEVQLRCDALTNFSLIETVIDCAIAAKKVEMAGGVITRTILDSQIQRFVTASSSGSVIEDLIALAAGVEVRTSSSGKKLKVQEFLTTGNWTRPSGVDSVEVLLVGGGGGGGGIATGPSMHGGAGSGGGGGVIKTTIPVTSIGIGASVTVTIGAGGSGGAGSGSGGGAGGNSTFGVLLTAGGGGGGDGINSASTVSSGGTGIATSGGGAATATGSCAVGGLGGGAGGSPTVTVSHSVGVSPTYPAVARYTRTGVLTHFPGITGLNNGQLTANSTNFGGIEVSAVGAPLYQKGAGGGVYAPNVSSAYPININGACGSGGGTLQNASANSGGGGSAQWISGSSGNWVGGSGGSGYCLVTWWE